VLEPGVGGWAMFLERCNKPLEKIRDRKERNLFGNFRSILPS
jgi:hypothetical protein